MSSPDLDAVDIPVTDRLPVRFLPTLLVNLIPLAGVVLSGWDPVTVITIYTVEVVLSFPIAGVKALFAQQPPRTDGEGVLDVSGPVLSEKRGQIDLPWLPPIHLRNVPFALTVFGGGVVAAMVVSLFLSWTIPSPAVLTRPAVLVSVAALLAGQLFDMGSDYFGDGRYRERSPYSVVETPARQLVVLYVLFLNPFTGEGGYPVVVLAVFVVFKLLVEWSASTDLLRDVSLVGDRLPDRWHDTRTISLTTGVGERETTRVLGPVSAADGFVETFELPLLTTALAPMDRRFLAASGLSFVALVGCFLALVLTEDPLTTAFFAGFLAPILAIPVGFWRASYSTER